MKKLLPILLMMMLALTGCATLSFKNEGVINVSGRGEVLLEPDYGWFTVTAEVSAPTTEEARVLSNDMMDKAVGILTERFGIGEDALKTDRMNFWPEYRWEKEERIITGQRAEMSVRVEIGDLFAIGEIYDALTEIDGIRLSGVTLDKKDKSGALEEARRLAVLDALEKADTYADAAGLEVAAIKSISSGAGAAAFENRVMYQDAMPEASMAKGSTTFHSSHIKVTDSLTLSVVTRVK